MWLTGLVAPRHVGSSGTRAQTRVSCIGRQILNHCATREARASGFVSSLPPSRGCEKKRKKKKKEGRKEGRKEEKFGDLLGREKGQQPITVHNIVEGKQNT